ncbi:MAG TPA: hypothetical protein VE360_05080 [Pyrinomonadaceae bacterium]|nr:hypothetical protein [Pyrinomonadaceae bacterium]
MLLSITASLAAGGFLLALVSDGFAYELSRVVEKLFDMIEYRLALQERRRGAGQPRERVAYEATYSHAG